MGCWLSSWRMLRRLGLQAVQVLRTADIPIFNGTVVAETEDYEVVEGNVYFQPESIKQEYEYVLSLEGVGELLLGYR